MLDLLQWQSNQSNNNKHNKQIIKYKSISSNQSPQINGTFSFPFMKPSSKSFTQSSSFTIHSPSFPPPQLDLLISAIQLISTPQKMQVNITGKPIKQFCTDTAQVVEAVDRQGTRLYAKLINIAKSQQKGYDQCLQFNTEVLQDLDDMIFKEHFLAVRAQVSNEELMGLITEPYDCNLAQYIPKQVLSEKDCMVIFEQLLKAVYSLVMNGYWHRNLRAEHFVRCGKVWKMESLVLSDDYSKAQGFNSEYLWSSKHEPPEFISGKQYQDEEYNQMTVWNLGCILLHLLVSSHRLSNKDVMGKFKNKPFTFQAIGIKSDKINKLSSATKELLGSMLHYDPKQRMKLSSLFQNKYASEVVSKHALQNKQAIPPSKISIGKSFRSSKLNAESKVILKDISTTLAQRQKQKQQLLVASRINSVVDDEDFLDNLNEISNKIPSKQYKFSGGKGEQLGGIQQLMSNKNHPIRKSLQLYKSYYDQSQLLVLAIDNIDKLEFSAFKQEWEVKEVRLLVKYAVVFVSLVNLNSLAQGFNQSRNILDLDGDQFTIFQNSHQYSAFQKFVNFKRGERSKQLDALRQEITFFKKKNLATKDQKVFDLLQRDFRKTNFQQIKAAYRMILKFAYDSISQQYNRHKRTQLGIQLSQRAMFVTYCLTIDKLYIKEHIPDNFKYYFQWIGKPASNYVPLNDFKDYILKAPKQVLIENSRYILKKYYNI